MKTTLELVHELKALLSGPERWTKGETARDKNGINVGPCDKTACCWCLYGALKRICDYDHLMILNAEEAVQKALGFKRYIACNDAPERTFSDIQALLIRMEELTQVSAQGADK